MNILHIHRLFASSADGWEELARPRPSALRMFMLLVLPFSLIPPLMLEYAGHSYGTVMFPASVAHAWSIAALFFLFAELITVPLMAWAIKTVANSKGISSDYHDAFMLAAVAPVPLWLSSLALFSDQPGVVVGVVVLGVIASVVLIFRGVQRILKVKESLVAFDIANIVTSFGLIAWVSLVMLGLVPALR